MKRPTKHLVADARLRDDEVWVLCSCGVTVPGDEAEAMREAFQRHRLDDGSPRGEASVRHDGVHGQSWRKGGNDVNPARAAQLRAAARRYYESHRADILERRRARKEQAA